MRLESTGKLGAKDHSAAMWEINNRRAKAETGAQLSVNYLDEKDTGMDLGGRSEVVEISSGFRCVLKVELEDFVDR